MRENTVEVFIANTQISLTWLKLTTEITSTTALKKY